MRVRPGECRFVAAETPLPSVRQLAAAAGLAATVLPIEPGLRKLFQGSVSILSSAGLVLGLVLDQRRAVRLAASIAEPVEGAAMLRRRRLSDYYRPAWELLPWGIAAATLGAVFLRGGSDLRLHQGLWVYPLLQFTLGALLLGLALRKLVAAPCISRLPRALSATPAAAAREDDRIRRIEIRHAFQARTGIMVLLGCMAWERMTGAVWVGPAQWAIVVLLLAIFARYAVQAHAAPPAGDQARAGIRRQAGSGSVGSGGLVDRRCD